MENITSHQILFVITLFFVILRAANYRPHPIALIINTKVINEWKEVISEMRIMDYIFVALITFINFLSIMFSYYCICYQIWYWFIVILKIP